MLNFSKSKYCGLWQCPKIAWLQKYKPEERVIDSSAASRMTVGNEVGDLAMGLFGDFVEVTVPKGDSVDIPAMISATRTEMQKGTPVICEASFEFEGLYCAVDLLRREKNGWAIYEVKSSTHDDKAVYIADISYQRFVLEQCEVPVSGTYLVSLNPDYILDGVLNLQELFRITDVGPAVDAEIVNILPNLTAAQSLLDSQAEPGIDLSEACNNPYPCAFWKYCSRNLPKPSVFDLYRLPFKKKLAYYYQGLAAFESLSKTWNITNDKQLRQMEFALTDKPDYVDSQKIREFLNQLSYPLYFLDFETVQPAIPVYEGTKPYTQVPFQYSLHYIETEGGELLHKEYLAEPEVDPRRELAERLCQDIPADACVTAYNKAFECTRIKELAELFPNLSQHLLAIRDNIVDLLTPFQSGWYYNRAMGGSFSIKSVLPALFPNDPELDYHNLDGVHNGSEAMTVFPAMASMTLEERAETRQNLLKYCGLDTYAMVKVWEKLTEAAEK